MKFQLKVMAAAMVLAASLPAHALMDLPQDLVNETGNSSMVLALFDRQANVSATFDLGLNYSDFNKIGTSFADSNVDALGTSFSWDLTSGDYGTAWSIFLPLVTSANVQWAVLGGDNFGAGAGNTSLIATLNQPTVTAVTTYTTGAMKTQLGIFQGQLANAQFPTQLYQNHTEVANGASVSNAALSTQNITSLFLGNKVNNAGSVVTANFDQSMSVFQVAAATLNTAQPTNIIFANNAQFTLSSAGLLTYTTDPAVTPIPEADTWAMMLLGLGFMGFAARRKQA